MQKIILLIIITITAIFVKGQRSSKASDNIESKTIALEHFDKINSEMVFSVEIRKSNEEKAVITSNYMRFVEVNVKNNTLQIGYKKNQPMENVDTKIVIYAKDVKSVNAEVGSVVKIKDQFDIQKFSTESGGKIFGDSNAKSIVINTESGGSVLGTVNTENLILNAQSGSSIDIQGKIETAKITAQSASRISATKTNVSVATVTAESASSVSISVSKELTASASSMDRIRYKTLSGIKFSADRDSGGTIDML
ncbi:GIN domain-containing protein [Epilithonimonas vandammei]|uniref:GIN domain-containing protein n=1 Tax=Epilithonimonas vandammei TaxID=2487072 RepID=UPI0028A7D1C2|nr:DUF2807 domain-containing protein [Epilithonimonas vandammei]